MLPAFLKFEFSVLFDCKAVLDPCEVITLNFREQSVSK